MDSYELFEKLVNVRNDTDFRGLSIQKSSHDDDDAEKHF